jgi:hypothetical protein
MSRPKSKPPKRSVTVLRQKDERGVVLVCMTIESTNRSGKTTIENTSYCVREIRCDIGGRGFEMHKVGLGTMYHVRVGDSADCECECMGYLRYGSCRHVLSLLALTKNGKL